MPLVNIPLLHSCARQEEKKLTEKKKRLPLGIPCGGFLYSFYTTMNKTITHGLILCAVILMGAGAHWASTTAENKSNGFTTQSTKKISQTTAPITNNVNDVN